MSRNLVPRANKDADLGTPEKNWNRLYVDAVILQGNDLKTNVDSKVDKNTLTNKGDLYTATGPGTIVRLPKGADGCLLTTNSLKPEGLEWSPGDVRQPIMENITVTVGTGGNFATINQAIDSITSLYTPKYSSSGTTPNVHRAIIRLLPGFVMSEQVLVKSLDLSWITIIGDDDETTINRSALTTNPGTLSFPAFSAMDGGFLPIIGQLFYMDTSGTAASRVGIQAYNNSRAIVLPNCGVRNAWFRSIYAAYGSTINADGANASGSGKIGIYAEYGSIINAKNINTSGAGTVCIYAVYGSTINADGANASRTTGSANGIQADSGSMINAQNADASGPGYAGIQALYCSTINANGANASGASNGIRALFNSTINAREAIASGAGGNGIYAIEGSTINAHNANASGAGNVGIMAEAGSTINAVSADATNAAIYGIFAKKGSRISADRANASGADNNNIIVQTGSIISAYGATGVLSQTKNTITSSGIIFQQ